MNSYSLSIIFKSVGFYMHLCKKEWAPYLPGALSSEAGIRCFCN